MKKFRENSIEKCCDLMFYNEKHPKTYHQFFFLSGSVTSEDLVEMITVELSSLSTELLEIVVIIAFSVVVVVVVDDDDDDGDGNEKFLFLNPENILEES